MTAALIIVALAGAVAFVVQEVRLRAVMAANATLEAELRAEKNRSSVLSQDLKLATELVRTLREEVQGHLEVIRACDDPSTIRDLADKLLNDPWFGTNPRPKSD